MDDHPYFSAELMTLLSTQLSLPAGDYVQLATWFLPFGIALLLATLARSMAAVAGTLVLGTLVTAQSVVPEVFGSATVSSYVACTLALLLHSLGLYWKSHRIVRIRREQEVFKLSLENSQRRLDRELFWRRAGGETQIVPDDEFKRLYDRVRLAMTADASQ